MAREDGRVWAVFDHPTDPSTVKNNVARRVLEIAGLEPAELLLDLSHVAMSVYSADLRIPRRFSEDQWSRDLRHRTAHYVLLSSGVRAVSRHGFA